MFEKGKKLVMCQACRALIDPSAKVCPMCGLDAVPARRVAGVADGHFISILILTVNIALFILVGIVGARNGGGIQSFIGSPAPFVLKDFGSFDPALFKAGQWWRLVTWNFLHIGLMHLLFNSFALVQIGPVVEGLYGSPKFVFIYLATGIFSGLASYQFGINTAGASGAIFGLIGLMAVYGYRQGGTWGRTIMRQMLVWAGLGILLGFMIHANNVAHIGGFIAGAALGFLLKGEAPETARAANVWNAVAVVCVLVITVSFVFVAKNYGALQENGRRLEIERQRIQQGGENIIALSNLVYEAGNAIKELADTSQNRPTVGELNRLSAELRDVTKRMSNLPSIDEPSDAIRGQLAALLNRYADKADAAQKEPAAKFILTDKELAEAKVLFEQYKDWEKSVIHDYGLEYRRPEK